MAIICGSKASTVILRIPFSLRMVKVTSEPFRLARHTELGTNLPGIRTYRDWLPNGHRNGNMVEFDSATRHPKNDIAAPIVLCRHLETWDDFKDNLTATRFPIWVDQILLLQIVVLADKAIHRDRERKTGRSLANETVVNMVSLGRHPVLRIWGTEKKVDRDGLSVFKRSCSAVLRRCGEGYV